MDEDELLNGPGPLEEQEKERARAAIAETGVKDIPLEKIGGTTREELTRMAGFAKLSNATEEYPMHAEVYEFDEAKLLEDGYSITYVENEEWGTRAAVVTKGDEVTVSFRGTQNGKNIFSDLNMVLVTSTFMEGRVHQGFYRAFQSLWSGIRDAIDDHAISRGMESKELEFNFTGHSMGGAMAKIGAWYVHKEWEVSPDNIKVATFGDPRVFDTRQAVEYDKALGENTVRVVQHRIDIVPAVATGSMGYKHVGAQVRIGLRDTDIVHEMDGYANGVTDLPKDGFVKSDSVSFFYYPSKLMQYLNELIIGTIQHLVQDLKGSDHKGFADKEREARKESWTNKVKQRDESNEPGRY